MRRLLVALTFGMSICSIYYVVPKVTPYYYHTSVRLPWSLHINHTDFSNAEGDASSYLCINNERLSVMSKHCNSADLSLTQSLTKRTLQHIFVDDTHKIMACLITKAACSTWKIIMLNSTGKVNVSRLGHLKHVHNPGFWKTVGLHRLMDYSQEEIAYRLANYYKFISVRHPFDRLLSAYGDKIVPHRPRYTNGSIPKRIVRRYRANATEHELDTALDVTFKEFVTFLLDSNPQSFDRHWQLYEDMCDPCRVHYDYIARLETISDDAKVIVPKFGLSDSLTIPKNNAFGASTRLYTLKEGKLLSEFSSLSAEQIEGLRKLYGRELAMFGYTWQDGGNIAKCYNNINGRVCC